MTGAVIKLQNRSISGSIASSGITAQSLQKYLLLTASLLSSAILRKQTSKRFTGSISSSGAMDDMLVFMLQLLGSISSVQGSIRRSTTKDLDSAISLNGNNIKSTNKKVFSTLSSSGSVVKLRNKTLNSFITPSGSTVRQFRRSLFLLASVASSGSHSKALSRTLNGSVGSSGTTRRFIGKILRSAIASASLVLNVKAEDIPAISGVIEIDSIYNITLIYEDASIVLTIDGI
jgi:hypothetical protein